jgi:hypothetical protein
MATYRALADISFGSSWPYAQAGTILVDGPGGNIPNNWVPPGCVDPLDGLALAAFYAAGPQMPGKVQQQWTGIGVSPPTTKWVPVGPNAGPGLYQLTGLGAGLPAQQFFGAAPPC